jgi:hypothetical protein
VKNRGLFQWLVGLAVLAVFTFLLVGMFRAISNLRQSPAKLAPSATMCAPTPASRVVPTGPATATPKPSEYGTVGPQEPTNTPIPINKTTDMSPGVATQYKSRMLVFHCDGTYELFLNAIEATQIPLRPGDVIIYAAEPHAFEGAHPPAATVAAPEPSTTALPPSTPVTPQITSTGQPYPVPVTSGPTPAQL